MSNYYMNGKRKIRHLKDNDSNGTIYNRKLAKRARLKKKKITIKKRKIIAKIALLCLLITILIILLS